MDAKHADNMFLHFSYMNTELFSCSDRRKTTNLWPVRKFAIRMLKIIIKTD